MLSELEFCPCGTGGIFNACCGPYLDGRAHPPTAEALMRSRYTAYTLGSGTYLKATGHHAESAEELSEFGRSARWLGLTVFKTRAGAADAQVGEVSFLARLELDGTRRVIAECSHFSRDSQGHWFYSRGEAPALGRNDRCPCGSGKKFKRCCGGLQS